ncbi:hypothetical protein Rruber_01002 [Rhodococcus ruber]|uniref:O-antigen ligase family protein n=1 Tax=Rhodococcus ruber TaxID=1830 RepID=UPI00315D9317
MTTATKPAARGPASTERLLPRSFTAVHLVLIAAATATVLAIAAVATGFPAKFPVLLLLAAIAGAMVAAGLHSPVVALFLLLLTTFLRVALPPILPVDPFVLAYAGVIAALGIWMYTTSAADVRVGAVEAAMALYVVWNIGSILASHRYLATVPVTGASLSVVRFVLTGVLIPFTAYLVGRYVFVRVSAIRALLWIIAVLAAYSAAVSIMQFLGPKALVWPRYIVTAPIWEGRAVGIFNQPVVNGMVLILGFVVALVLSSERTEPRFRRLCAAAVAGACAYGVYFTHTRAVWLGLALVVVAGMLWARGFRTGFVLAATTAVIAIATNWQRFTGTDRSAGGIGSPAEVQDRLNTAGTALWAIGQRPLTGWGIGRFTAVNTYHHKQWSPEVPWIRGFAISSHFNELGIAAELGLIGLGLWIAVVVLLAVRLFRAYRILPEYGLDGRRMALLGLLGLLVMAITGLTVDLRFFDFPNAAVMVLIGVAIGCADRYTAEAGSAKR